VTTVASDYSSGSFATVSLSDWSIDDGLFVSSSDTAVSTDEGWVFQINRYGFDTVRLYEPGTWGEPIWEQDVGELSNPHDAEICNGDLFVSLYGKDFMGVYDLSSGILKGTVDLSAYQDSSDVGPEATKLVELDGMLYVSMNRLNRDKGWIDAGGMVAEIDCASMATTNAWPVAGNTEIYPWHGEDKLLVTGRAFGDDVGGLYALDPAAETVTLIVESVDTSFSGVAANGDTAIVIGMADDFSSYNTYCVDLVDGVADMIDESGSYLTKAVANTNGEAWITAAVPWIDPKASSGIIVYDIETCSELTSTPLEFGFAPNAVAFY
jgi:hypothetical protein